MLVLAKRSWKRQRSATEAPRALELLYFVPTMASESASPKTCNLPSEKVFSIQVGCETFRLSGASIASDGQ